MSIINPSNPEGFFTLQPKTEASTGFAENFRQSVKAAQEAQMGNSRHNNAKEIWADTIERLEAVAIESADNPNFEGLNLRNPEYYGSIGIDFLLPEETEKKFLKNYHNAANKVINTINEFKDELKSKDPTLLDISIESVEEQTKQISRDALEEFEDFNKADKTFMGKIGSFAGGFRANITDPVNIAVTAATLPMTSAKTLLGVMLQEAMINAGAETLVQSEVRDWYKEIGAEYTQEDFNRAVRDAALFGAVFSGTLKIGGKTIKLTAKQMKKGLELLRGGKNSPANKAAEQVLDIVEHSENSPIVSNVEHQKRVQEADIAVANNVAPTTPNTPISAVKTSALDRKSSMFQQYDPDEIEVDAKTFQFKSDGDEFGVTERLKGVTTWDEDLAGIISVYEYRDGRAFIADGHQRLGLAKRLRSEQPDANIILNAMVYREADGVTPEMARVRAAVKNIAQGTGTPLDAAKIFREAPDEFSRLPPKSALAMMAQGIGKLKGDAWGMVVNEKVDFNIAAEVGKILDEPGQQLAAMKVLANLKTQGRRVDRGQAEQIVRQIREEGFDATTQSSLFGDEVLQESVYLERAKVLQNVIKKLKQNKRVFSTLTREAGRVESAGNVLAKTANERLLNQDNMILQGLSSLANRKGVLSDELTKAAKIFKDTKSLTKATDEFSTAIERAISDGDFAREIGRSPGRFDENTGQSLQLQEEPSQASADLEKFSEPGGKGSQEQTAQMKEEKFSAEEMERDNLIQLIDSGAELDEIGQHPAVIRALEQQNEMPLTSEMPGYGSAEWNANRVFNFKDGPVKGYSDAINKFLVNAESLAWDEMNIPFSKDLIKRQKKAVIVLGAPAAGKSTLANPIAVKYGAAIVDSDEVKKVMPEFAAGVGANAVHEESSAIGKSILNAQIAMGNNIVLPKVGDNLKSIQKSIQNFKDAGYDVTVMNMKVSPEEAMKRMFSRFAKTGRLINVKYASGILDNPSQTYISIREKGDADGFIEIDNNGPFGEEPFIIEDTRKILEGFRFRHDRSGKPRRVTFGTEPSTVDRTSGQILETETQEGLDFEVSLEDQLDTNTGEVTSQLKTLRQVKEELDLDENIVKRLEYCVV